jgi:holo-[acyl-carrier protein] synthase
MIVGIGTDIIQTARVKELCCKYGDKFLKRVLTLEEQAKCKSLKPEEHAKYLTKRFAAKEAFVKALGTGFNNHASLHDVSIDNDSAGKPYYKLSDKLRDYLISRFNTNKYAIHLSISDTLEYANAIAIIETV